MPLVPGPAHAAPAAAAAAAHLQQRRSRLALGIGNRSALNAFLAQYPDGFYASLAKLQLDKIAAEETRVAATGEAAAEQERARTEGAPEDAAGTFRTSCRGRPTYAGQFKSARMSVGETAPRVGWKLASPRFGPPMDRRSGSRTWVSSTFQETKRGFIGEHGMSGEKKYYLANLPRLKRICAC